MELKEFHKLKLEDNHYYFTNTRDFTPLIFSNEEAITACFNFAYEMTFGDNGQHRDHRSGGSVHRKNGEIFTNAFQGKLAEFIFYYYYKEHYSNHISKPDLDCWELGKWDFLDFITIKNNEEKKVAIKSAKHFANLLLLETKDWNDKGIYLPNKNCKYDGIVLVRLDDFVTELMKKNRIFYNDSCEKHFLEKLLLNNKNIKYDIPGFISNTDLIQIINDKHIIKKDFYIGDKTRIDAENYYVQAGDLREF